MNNSYSFNPGSLRTTKARMSHFIPRPLLTLTSFIAGVSLVAGIVAEFEKIFDVGVPCFEINAARALSFPALIYGRDTGIQRLQPRHDPVRMTICAAN